MDRRIFLLLLSMFPWKKKEVEKRTKEEKIITLCKKCRAQRFNCWSCMGRGGYIESVCDECNGKGCKECENKGKIITAVEMNGTSKCPNCKGITCNLCSGKGKLEIKLCKKCKGLKSDDCNSCNGKGFSVEGVS